MSHVRRSETPFEALPAYVTDYLARARTSIEDPYQVLEAVCTFQALPIGYMLEVYSDDFGLVFSAVTEVAKDKHTVQTFRYGLGDDSEHDIELNRLQHENTVRLLDMQRVPATIIRELADIIPHEALIARLTGYGAILHPPGSWPEAVIWMRDNNERRSAAEPWPRLDS